MGLSTKNQTFVKENALRPMVDPLKTDEEAHACVFVNFCGKAGRMRSLPKDLGIESFLQVGVLTINGHMGRHQKFTFIWLFALVYQIDGYSFLFLWQRLPPTLAPTNRCVSIFFPWPHTLSDNASAIERSLGEERRNARCFHFALVLAILDHFADQYYGHISPG